MNCRNIEEKSKQLASVLYRFPRQKADKTDISKYKKALFFKGLQEKQGFEIKQKVVPVRPQDVL